MSEEQLADEIDDAVADEMECMIVSALHPQKWTTGEERRAKAARAFIDALNIGFPKDNDDPAFGRQTR